MRGELLARYGAIVRSPDLHWTTHYRKVRLLGKGGQGVVYLKGNLASEYESDIRVWLEKLG